MHDIWSPWHGCVKCSEGCQHCYMYFGVLIRSSRNARKLPKNNIQDFYIQSTVDFIENHYMNEISVEDMVANLGLNRSYFSKIFIKATQKSPRDFLIQYRINKACELLYQNIIFIHTSLPAPFIKCKETRGRIEIKKFWLVITFYVYGFSANYIFHI